MDKYIFISKDFFCFSSKSKTEHFFYSDFCSFFSALNELPFKLLLFSAGLQCPLMLTKMVFMDVQAKANSHLLKSPEISCFVSMILSVSLLWMSLHHSLAHLSFYTVSLSIKHQHFANKQHLSVHVKHHVCYSSLWGDTMENENAEIRANDWIQHLWSWAPFYTF